LELGGVASLRSLDERLGLGAVVLGTLVIAVSAEQPRAGLLVQAASVAAAVGVLILITRLSKGGTEVRS
jgi:hypothetical protein